MLLGIVRGGARCWGLLVLRLGVGGLGPACRVSPFPAVRLSRRIVSPGDGLHHNRCISASSSDPLVSSPPSPAAAFADVMHWGEKLSFAHSF